MSKIGIFFVTAALASSTAWAQQTSGQPAQHKGNERPAGVVTGGSADGGIALQSDSAKVDGSVSAVSGGVSVNARDNMRSQTPPHNIKMVFSLNTGNYVSDVHVKVTDRAGKAVIDDTSTGPWLFAKLPAGSYTATATYNGKAVTQKFSVGKSGVRTAQFRWPASVETQGVGSAGAEAGGQILGTGPQEPQQQ
jgi:hypothetical protein